MSVTDIQGQVARCRVCHTSSGLIVCSVLGIWQEHPMQPNLWHSLSSVLMKSTRCVTDGTIPQWVIVICWLCADVQFGDKIPECWPEECVSLDGVHCTVWVDAWQYEASFVLVLLCHFLTACRVTSRFSVWLQLLDRDQQRLEVIRIPVHCFVSDEERANYHEHQTPTLQVLIQETSDVWINVCTW